MAGIANVIPGADFSNSILGRVTKIVTPAEKAAEIVSTYTTAIGNTTFAPQLRTLVKTLIEAGAWEGIDIYPMLGSTLTHKQVNLNPNDGLLGTPILFGENASNVEDGVSFVTMGSSAVGLSGIERREFPWANKTGLFICADMQHTGTTGTQSTLYFSRNAANNASFRMQSSATAKQVFIEVGSTSSSTSIYTENYRFLVAASLGADNVRMYTDGALETTTAYANPSSTAIVRVHNILGATENDTASTSYNGIAKFWALGYIDPSKHEAVINAIKAFMDSVKPRS